jgi:hypothetical protein
MRVLAFGIARLGRGELDFRRSEVSATAETHQIRPPPERLQLWKLVTVQRVTRE